MFMKRWFDKQFSMGSHGTAEKIMRELTRNHNDAVDSSVLTKDECDKIKSRYFCDPNGMYEWHGGYFTENTKLYTPILADAIEKTINYSEYQKLPEPDKKRLRTFIVQILAKEAKNFDNSAPLSLFKASTSSEERVYTRTRTGKGIMFGSQSWYGGNQAGWVHANMATFPPDFFKNSLEIQNCIKKAIIERNMKNY